MKAKLRTYGAKKWHIIKYIEAYIKYMMKSQLKHYT